jgi:hypothetical protein
MRACGAKGHIVNISSSTSQLEAPDFYGATKAAVNAIVTWLDHAAPNPPAPWSARPLSANQKPSGFARLAQKTSVYFAADTRGYGSTRP